MWIATSWPFFYMNVLVVVYLGLLVKHRSICALFAGLAAFVMHSAWASGFFLWAMVCQGGCVEKRQSNYSPCASRTQNSEILIVLSAFFPLFPDDWVYERGNEITTRLR